MAKRKSNLDLTNEMKAFAICYAHLCARMAAISGNVPKTANMRREIGCGNDWFNALKKGL